MNVVSNNAIVLDRAVCIENHIIPNFRSGIYYHIGHDTDAASEFNGGRDDCPVMNSVYYFEPELSSTIVRLCTGPVVPGATDSDKSMTDAIGKQTRKQLVSTKNRNTVNHFSKPVFIQLNQANNLQPPRSRQDFNDYFGMSTAPYAHYLHPLAVGGAGR
jgi:hypothetical protein